MFFYFFYDFARLSDTITENKYVRPQQAAAGLAPSTKRIWSLNYWLLLKQILLLVSILSIVFLKDPEAIVKVGITGTLARNHK